MDVHEDADLLWIADEALQAPEPVGWEERQDPRGNTYYCNTITNMTMVQHPVDYHYQQLYLQYKMQRQQHEMAELMTPRSRANFEAEQAKQLGREGSFKLDLRSVNADSQGEEAGATPRGWLKRNSIASMLTPRSGPSKKETEATRAGLESTMAAYGCIEVEVSVKRGTQRLGMELNAYNQILAFQPGGPTDKHPNMHIHDRIVAVDSIQLGERMLTDVLQPRDVQKFVLERWQSQRNVAGRLPPEVLLHLGKARHGGQSVPDAMRAGIDEGVKVMTQKKRSKKWQGNNASADGPSASRFTVSIRRGETGLGLVLDEENIVVDMVPGSPVDNQREEETDGDPRLQIGDRIMTVDGLEVSIEKPLSQVIDPQATHAFSIERIVERKAIEKAPASSSPMSPRGMLKAMTPRSSKADKGSKDASPQRQQPALPPRGLREIRIFKAHEDERLGIRFVRDDEGFDRQLWGRDDMVCPIVAALDPKGEAARAGIEIDDMVLSINGQTGLSNTEAAAMLRDLQGTIVVVVRKCVWLGVSSSVQIEQQQPSTPTPETPRTAMRRLV